MPPRSQCLPRVRGVAKVASRVKRSPKGAKDEPEMPALADNAPENGPVDNTSVQPNAQDLPEGTTALVDLNMGHLVEVDDAIKVILGHPVFENILTAQPLAIDKNASAGESGHKAPFDKSDYAAAMSTAGCYEAACNMWSASLRWTATPGVPYNRTAIKRLMEHTFSSANTFKRFPFARA